MTNSNNYIPREDEREKASNGYLMSVVALMAGLPLPIINLFAAFMFSIANRHATPFVRWHCTQALLSQCTMLIMNSVGFSWTMHVLFGNGSPTNSYFAYMFTIIAFNVVEVIVNIAAAVSVRKGKHVRWWFWAPMTDMFISPSSYHPAK
jgi:uncharacterized Tic20 family protein